MGRAPCCDKANVKKGPWSPEEDATLKDYIEQNGTGGNWIALPQKIGLKRCGKSCRLRWLNYLRPNLKHGGFSEEEDTIICNLYISIGSRWSIIAAQLPGRTDNDIKNYWNTRLKKKLLGKRKESHARRLSTLNQDPKDSNRIDDNPYSQALSSSALERLQLHLQLQNLQNPFSFYNNPALWPKLHPLGERILQSHHGLSHNPSALMQQAPNFQTEPYQKVGFQELPADGQANSTSSNPKQDELENSMNGFSPADSSSAFNSGSNPMNATIMSKSDGVELLNMEFQMASGLQADLNNILFSKPSGLIQHKDQTTDMECFEEFNGSKDNMIWWSNDFDTKLYSSNSWDSASVLHPEGMFQDYILGYDL